MADTSFGPGDISANDYGISIGIYYVNWGTTTVSNGGLGRLHGNFHCRWGSGSVPHTATGHNTLWNSGHSRVATTGNFNVTTIATGTYNNGTITETWQNATTSYYGGYYVTSKDDQTTPFRDGTGGSYAGKPSSGSTDDANNSGGDTNWAGVGSPGGLGWSVTFFRSDIYVRRSGAWARVPVYVKRSGAWVQVKVFVRRSGAWTALNYLEEVPAKGLSVEVNVGEGWEKGYLTEERKGWFGSVDPTLHKEVDLLTCPPGSYDVPFFSYSGRFNDEEPEELVEQRLEARHEWDQALRWENYGESKIWYPKFQSDNIPVVEPIKELVVA